MIFLSTKCVNDFELIAVVLDAMRGEANDKGRDHDDEVGIDDDQEEDLLLRSQDEHEDDLE